MHHNPADLLLRTDLCYFHRKCRPDLCPPAAHAHAGFSVGMTVVAEYEYVQMTPHDLELRKDEEYTLLEISDPIGLKLEINTGKRWLSNHWSICCIQPDI